MLLVHATCLDVAGVGVLLRGPSGCGKSDLALRLIDGGARLVADDRVDLAAADDGLVATAPPNIAGILEVRGLGLIEVPSESRVRVGLVVDLVPPEEIERLPEAATRGFEGIDVARVAITPFEASACAKVRLAALATQRNIVLSQ